MKFYREHILYLPIYRQVLQIPFRALSLRRPVYKATHTDTHNFFFEKLFFRRDRALRRPVYVCWQHIRTHIRTHVRTHKDRRTSMNSQGAFAEIDLNVFPFVEIDLHFLIICGMWPAGSFAEIRLHFCTTHPHPRTHQTTNPPTLIATHISNTLGTH